MEALDKDSQFKSTAAKSSNPEIRTTRNKNPFVSLSKLDLEVAEQYSEKNIINKASPSFSTSPPNCKKSKTNAKNKCRNAVQISSKQPQKKAQQNKKPKLYISDKVNNNEREDTGENRSCFICRCSSLEDESELDEEGGERFETYRRLVEVLDSNHRLPDADLIDQELQYCCQVCFIPVKYLLEYQEELQQIKAHMMEIVQKIKDAIRLRYKVSVIQKPNSKYHTSRIKKTAESLLKSHLITPDDRNNEHNNNLIINEFGELVEIKEERIMLDDVDEEDTFQFEPSFSPQAFEDSSQWSETHAPSSSRPSRSSKAKASRLIRSVVANDDETEDWLPNKSDDDDDDEYRPNASVDESNNDRFEDGLQTTKGSTSKKSSCDHCNKSFTQYSKLLRHMTQVHGKEGKKPDRVCPHCNRRFWTTYDLNRHLKSNISKTTNKLEIICKTKSISRRQPGLFNTRGTCEICGKTVRRLLYHIQRVHERLRPFKCSICPWAFYEKKDLVRHTRKHTKEKPYQCNKCWKNFSRQDCWKDHQKKCNADDDDDDDESLGESEEEKTDVNKNSTDLIDTSESGEVAIGKNPASSSSVGSNTERVEKLRRRRLKKLKRLRNLRQPENFLCKFCTFSSEVKLEVLKHQNEVHQQFPPIPAFQCQTCQKRFHSIMNLKRHMEIHKDINSSSSGDGVNSNKIKIQCNICEIFFKTKSSLLSHNKRLHKTSLLHIFSCTYCSRRFQTKRDLERHILIHTGEKSFCCEVCGRQFSRSDYLLSHLRRVHHKIGSTSSLKPQQLQTTVTTTNSSSDDVDVVSADTKQHESEFQEIVSVLGTPAPVSTVIHQVQELGAEIECPPLQSYSDVSESGWRAGFH